MSAETKRKGAQPSPENLQVITPHTRATEWFIFILLLVCYTYFLPRWADWNVNSRMDAIFAVVDQNTLAIDAYYKNTGDYAFYNGHYYSDKAPGTLFLGIPFYAAFKLGGGGALIEMLVPRVSNSAFAATLNAQGRGMVAESLYFFAALVWVTFFTSAIPSALLGVLLYRFALVWANSSTLALVVALAYGLATPAFAYANNLYGHQLSAFLLFAAFYLAYRAARGRRPMLYAALTGLALGTALITEYPTALIVGGMGIYALYTWRDVKMILVACAAGLPPLLLMLAHNFAIFQTPLPVGYLYSPLYSELHHTGLISLTYPKLDVLFQLMFGAQRGLFLLSPFLFVSLFGFIWFARERTARAEFFLTLWAVVSFWLFNSSSAMWQGGFGVGPRYLVPMLPFMALPFVFVLNYARTWWMRAAIVVTIALSWLLIWITTLSGQQFPQYQKVPLLEYSLPRLAAGEIARNAAMFINLGGWLSLLPLILAVSVMTIAYLVWTRSGNFSMRAAAPTSRIA